MAVKLNGEMAATNPSRPLWRMEFLIDLSGVESKNILNK